jgi:hypothetical protein
LECYNCSVTNSLTLFVEEWEDSLLPVTDTKTFQPSTSITFRCNWILFSHFPQGLSINILCRFTSFFIEAKLLVHCRHYCARNTNNNYNTVCVELWTEWLELSFMQR